MPEIIMNHKKLIFSGLVFLSSLQSALGISCYQCASTEGKQCPRDNKLFSSPVHDACITWRLGNGTILLQNLVSAGEECTKEKIVFWSRFIDLYYKTQGGYISCCYTDGCNNGSEDDSLVSVVSSISQGAFPPTAHHYPHSHSTNLNGVTNPLLGGLKTQLSGIQETNSPNNGNCERYFEKVSADEWVPDTLVPLAYDRASQGKVGVFFVKLGDRNSANDHVVVRLLNKAKQNLTMYSIKLHRVGSVSIHINKLEPASGNSRNAGGFVQVDGKKVVVNDVIDIDNNDFHGFWISIRNDIDISIGRLGHKLVDPIANYTDLLREGPSDSYYFGLTTTTGTFATFGVNCDMPGLHFEDTCVTDADCEEFPETVCRESPVNPGLDPGIRLKSFNEWKQADTILKSCWCAEGRIRIPESRGCYDPVRKVVTLRDACFADYHCNDLPNTVCAQDIEMERFNMSCQCMPGHKPFDPDPRTGLVEGCAPLTSADKATVTGCSRRFTLEGKAEWVPETTFPLKHDIGTESNVAVFYVKFGPLYTGGRQGTGTRKNEEDHVAVIRLLDENKDRKKMLTVKIFRKDGKVALYESKVTRSFFFSNEVDNELAKYEDYQTKMRLEEDFVGFWIQYKYNEGYGGQISVGLNGSPFSPDYALVRYTDTSNTAIKAMRYIGFTGEKGTGTVVSIGANCVLVTPPPVSLQQQQQQPQQSLPLTDPNYLAAYQQLGLSYPGSEYGGSVGPFPSAAVGQPAVSVPSAAQTINPWSYVLPKDSLTVEHTLKSKPEQVIVEPVLKSQYLTKLSRESRPDEYNSDHLEQRRLLPTFLEGVDEEQVAAALEQAANANANAV